jgi:hypothetical protein
VARNATTAPVQSRDWAAANRPAFIGAATEAVMKAIGDHGAEQAAKTTKS